MTGNKRLLHIGDLLLKVWRLPARGTNKNQVYLGSDGSVARMQALIDPNRPLREVPLKQRRSVAKPLKYFSTQYLNRDEAIAAAYGTGAYTMQSIADYLDIGRMTG